MIEAFLLANWPWLLAAAAWTLPWKGLALWTAARKGHKLWFVVLLLVNTLAVLEIAYIFYFSRHYGTGTVDAERARP